MSGSVDILVRRVANAEPSSARVAPPPTVASRATLTVLTGAYAGQSVVIDAVPVAIGRAFDADLVVDGVGVSLHHLRVARTVEDDFYAEDLGSEGGTFSGENRIGIKLLRNGDSLRLGSNLKLGVAIVDGTDGRPLPGG